ncbi:MAG: TetR/AcrR family transcriptional regulator [Ilumatobacteraceae bacterium]
MPMDSQERERLLELVAGYCLEHGVADLTLRRVGQSVGSNNRMLLYYFGSKEQMISAALKTAGQRFPELLHAFELLDVADRPLHRRLDDAWRAISAEANLPFIRLFFDVFGLAAHQPGRFDDFLGRVGHDWAERVAVVLRKEGLRPAQARRTGREVVALWRGLQVDLLTSGDRGRVDRTHTAAAQRIAATVLQG